MTAGTVTLGGLDALDVYQFRVVLHRDGLPDHVGTASALAVPEDADSSTLSAAPAVAPLWSAAVGSYYRVTWAASAGTCRERSPFAVEVAAAAAPSEWRVAAPSVLRRL